MQLKFKTGEPVFDDNNSTQKADVVARLQMWLIDDEYMAKTDVHALVRDALSEIEQLREKNSNLRGAAAREESLADALAFTTSGLIALVPIEVVESLGEFATKVQIVLDAWTNARRLDD